MLLRDHLARNRARPLVSMTRPSVLWPRPHLSPCIGLRKMGRSLHCRRMNWHTPCNTTAHMNHKEKPKRSIDVLRRNLASRRSSSRLVLELEVDFPGGGSRSQPQVRELQLS